ncbi:hypothetical protein ACLOJK_010358, partial [Asimina triloba]
CRKRESYPRESPKGRISQKCIVYIAHVRTSCLLGGSRAIGWRVSEQSLDPCAVTERVLGKTKLRILVPCESECSARPNSGPDSSSASLLNHADFKEIRYRSNVEISKKNLSGTDPMFLYKFQKNLSISWA